MKRFLLLLTLAVAASGTHADTFTLAGISYTVLSSADRTLKVDSTSHHNYAGHLAIPQLVSHDGAEYTVVAVGDEAFADCEELLSIMLPATVATIGDWAFSGCTGLTAVEMPGVETIGNDAFGSCESLTAVHLPATLRAIDSGAFQYCTSLASLTVDDDNPVFDSRQGCNAVVRTATDELVIGCSATVIPDDIKSIGNSAFFGCTTLTDITLPEGLQAIGDYAFGQCRALQCITIPEGVTRIGTNMCFACVSLREANVGSQVREIGNMAFAVCSSLESFTIPAGVERLGFAVFNNCTALRSLYCLIATPPAIMQNMFVASTFTDCTLYVQEASLELYRDADVWRNFTHIATVPTLGIGGLPTRPSAAAPTDGAVYHISGQQVGNSNADFHRFSRGIYLKNGKKVLVP